MKNIELKNIARLFGFNMYIRRRTIIGWCIALFGVMSLYMILFPSVQDMAQLKLEAMPEELLQFVGMSSFEDMGDYTTYYATIFSLVLVAAAIFAATFSAGLITKEEKSKSIEFVSSLAVSRTEVYIAKFLVSCVATSLVVGLAVIAAILCGFINAGDTFNLSNILLSAKTTGFTAVFFGGIALALAGISPRLGSGGVGSMAVGLCYMCGYLGQILGEDAEFLLYFSPFISFSTQNSLDMGTRFWATFAVYFAIYVVALVAGGVAYSKRDLQV